MNRKAANVILIIFIVICFYFVMGNTSKVIKNSYQKEHELEKLTVQIQRDSQSGGYRLVNSVELGLIIKKADPVIVDTRPLEEFKKNYIEGSINFALPQNEMENWDTSLTHGKTIRDFQDMLGADKKRLIVFYGKDLRDRSSHNGAKWAATTGFENVLKLCGGIISFKGAGMKVIYSKKK